MHVVRGLRSRSWIEVCPPREQIAAEGYDADGCDHRGPGGEEEPPALERNESLRVMGLIRHPRFLFWREAGQSGLAPDYENSRAVSTSGAFNRRYCAGGAGGA